jgi:hypothetical protein
MEQLLTDVIALAVAAITLDRSAFVAALDPSRPLGGALAVALLSGLSLTIGQCVILFANGVSRRRFLICALVMAGVYVLGLVVWGASIWLLSRYILGWTISLHDLVISVCLGQAPMLYAFLVVIPYFGSSIRRLLEAWSLVIVVSILGAVLEVPPLGALAMSGLGWAVRAVVVGVLQQPLAGMQTWLWRAASGQANFVNVHDLPGMLASRAIRDARPLDPRAPTS